MISLERMEHLLVMARDSKPAGYVHSWADGPCVMVTACPRGTLTETPWDDEACTLASAAMRMNDAGVPWDEIISRLIPHAPPRPDSPGDTSREYRGTQDVQGNGSLRGTASRSGLQHTTEAQPVTGDTAMRSSEAEQPALYPVTVPGGSASDAA